MTQIEKDLKEINKLDNDIQLLRRENDLTELSNIVKSDVVDKLLEKNGVLYNSDSELDYQEEHE